MVRRARSWFLVTTCSVFLAGCTGGVKAPASAPVSGTVKLKGQPVEGVQVSFMPKQGAPRAAMGTTDARGKYKLTTFSPDDGAVIGTHTVTIAKATKTAPSSEPGFGKGAQVSQDYVNAMKGGGKSSATQKGAPDEAGGIPPKYASPTSSGLEAKVTKEGPNNFDFDLK
jgi:hypothetical protein